MLTSAPSSAFNATSHAGTLAVGHDGDLTVFASDPATGRMEDFADVLYTIRAGKIIFNSTAH